MANPLPSAPPLYPQNWQQQPPQPPTYFDAMDGEAYSAQSSYAPHQGTYYYTQPSAPEPRIDEVAKSVFSIGAALISGSITFVATRILGASFPGALIISVAVGLIFGAIYPLFFQEDSVPAPHVPPAANPYYSETTHSASNYDPVSNIFSGLVGVAVGAALFGSSNETYASTHRTYTDLNWGHTNLGSRNLGLDSARVPLRGRVHPFVVQGQQYRAGLRAGERREGSFV